MTEFHKNIEAIYTFEWPSYLLEKWRERFPSAPDGIEHEVSLGLKDWFAILASGHPRTFGMTSKSVDTLWHELILNTRLYASFCHQTVGFFVHHTTHAADSRMDAEKQQHLDNVRTWMAACAVESIDPHTPDRLPRLFQLDALICPEEGHVFSLSGGATNPSDWLKIS